ncbi:hypothetical protein P168DRAFT_24255 [Aspergillus campestris IBT 28561]|uniref:Uncharacterized protein n=1 Tax=Aspergillus campestris (strain IBT 28561) TaxID=1392248 RepID=A0A2I1DG48_ASPC2|nr:uncharacterized protein P168DRAFT_24255 [Aspergillus campestris IBT 28561]PKY08843.1 hypothetical protein P168DRAFT_24255 [Aspergillus campestris IBT 28561]
MIMILMGRFWASFKALRSIQLERWRQPHQSSYLASVFPELSFQHPPKDYMIVGIFRPGMDTRTTDRGGSLTEWAPRRSTFSVYTTDLLIITASRYNGEVALSICHITLHNRYHTIRANPRYLFGSTSYPQSAQSREHLLVSGLAEKSTEKATIPQKDH